MSLILQLIDFIKYLLKCSGSHCKCHPNKPAHDKTLENQTNHTRDIGRTTNFPTIGWHVCRGARRIHRWRCQRWQGCRDLISHSICRCHTHRWGRRIAIQNFRKTNLAPGTFFLGPIGADYFLVAVFDNIIVVNTAKVCRISIKDVSFGGGVCRRITRRWRFPCRCRRYRSKGSSINIVVRRIGITRSHYWKTGLTIQTNDVKSIWAWYIHVTTVLSILLRYTTIFTICRRSRRHCWKWCSCWINWSRWES
mmetsp:Transcript_9628/g.16815  ORF Transcript_9628/g.16815 Transcript_9628/m.16815 type:complete len:251 (-) Transcript_9628:473-1225(-)